MFHILVNRLRFFMSAGVPPLSNAAAVVPCPGMSSTSMSLITDITSAFSLRLRLAARNQSSAETRAPR